MIDTAATATAEPLAPNTATPAPTATPNPVAAAELLALDDIDADDAGGDVGEAARGDEGEPAEKPAWARPDDEEAAEAWREERGVPLDPDDYDLPVPDAALNDATFKETINGFTNLAHSLDLPQEGAAKLYEFVETRGREIMAARVEQDREEATSAKQVLAEEWGADAGNNLKAVNALLKELPSGLSKAIRDARAGNGLGSRLANEPLFLQMLAEYAALKNAGPTAGIFDGQADEKRIAEIKRARMDDFGTYVRHGLDKELATLEARQTARAPAAEGERRGDRAREAEIRKALRDDSTEYFRQGLDKELTAILQRRSAQ